MRTHLAILLLLPLSSGCLVVPVPYTMKASGKFHGRVVDAKTDAPIKEATVEVTGYPRTAQTTSASGEFNVGPARKWYGYIVIGFHQHVVPEPQPPEIVTFVSASHPDYEPRRQLIQTPRDKRSLQGSYEAGDVSLTRRREEKTK
jgi:hypothetical protein